MVNKKQIWKQKSDFNTPLKTMGKTFRQNISKETTDLTKYNWHYRIFHRTVEENTFFPSTYRTFSKKNHKLVHKTNFSSKSKSFPVSFLVTVKWNKKSITAKQNKIPGKFTHAYVIPLFWTTATKMKTKEKLKCVLRQIKIKTQQKAMGCCKSSFKREIYGNKCLY